MLLLRCYYLYVVTVATDRLFIEKWYVFHKVLTEKCFSKKIKYLKDQKDLL